MTNIKIYYLLNMDNDCIYHTTNQDEFIESALRYFKNELDFKVKTKTIDLN